jgi:hypothetical protein
VATALEGRDLVVGDIGDMAVPVAKSSMPTPPLPLPLFPPPLLPSLPFPLPPLPPPYKALVATALEAHDLVVGNIGNMVALISKRSVTPLLPLSAPLLPLPLPLTLLVPLPEPLQPALSLSIIDAGHVYLSWLPSNFWLVLHDAKVFVNKFC